MTIVPLTMENARACATAHPDWREAVPYWLMLQDQGSTTVLLAQRERTKSGGAQIVGLIEIAQPAGESAVIRNLDVLEAFQNRGIGGALIAAARSHAFADDALAAHGTIRLAVLEENERAAALYARLGFTPTGQVEETEDGPIAWMVGPLRWVAR